MVVNSGDVSTGMISAGNLGNCPAAFTECGRFGGM